MGINPATVIKVAKFVVSGTVALGTSKIVTEIVKSTVTPNGIMNKIAITAAAWVIGAKAAEMAHEATDKMVDDTIEMGQKGYAWFQEKKAEHQEEIAKLEEQKAAIKKKRMKLNRINAGVATLEDEGLVEGVDIEKDNDGVWHYIKKVEADSPPTNVKTSK